ncbi:hypothetical protein V6N13_064070 [Hibiscus sabdariffa]
MIGFQHSSSYSCYLVQRYPFGFEFRIPVEMAEVAVNLVLEKLVSFLNEEMQLLRDFHTEVVDIKLELDFISSFLRDADARAATEESNQSVRTWVKHIREAAYSIEDVIDEYMLYVAKHRDQHGFMAFLKKIAGYIWSLKGNREMVSKIQELNRFVHEIGNKRRRLDINFIERGGSSRGLVDPRAGLHFVENDELVGIESSIDELVGRLKDGEPMRTVISLVEMAQELLCRTAFRFDQPKECPDNLKCLSLDIARKCDGLPLAIVAIGGLLSTKGKDVLEWKRLRDDLSSLVVEIPDEMRYLCKLQYFRAYSVNHENHYNINTDQGVRINGSVIGSLESLEKLYYVDFQSQNGEHFCRELRRLKRLRKLGITKLKSDCGEALCGAIKQMHHLHALRISAVKEDDVLQLESMSPPSSLHRLRLHGRLVKLPGWISEMENLVKISLHWSRISDDSLKVLGDLPKLLEFWLYEGYDGVELHFEQGKFKKLKHLALRRLYKLEKLVMDRGCLPCLETLGIGPSPLLQEVPTNIGNLECLKNLGFYNMPKEFAQKIMPSQGPDYWKVKEIPNVCFHYKARGLYRQTDKLSDFRLRRYL